MKSVLPLMLSLLVASCQSVPAPGETRPDSPAGNSSLYTALGRRSGIEQVVEDLLYIIVDDERIAFQFRGLNVERFHSNLSDQLCELSGGPCSYTGMSMEESHEAMDISQTQFNALVEGLILAMEKNHIPPAIQNRLLARLIPLHPEIVGS
ncbi:group 1 truncated hemoglobin [Marinobacter sp.]|uniref:group I truncated hemoglobin n=1 Tax=Marinobacter sp. TaxID=50741 RepID=UPI00384B9955